MPNEILMAFVDYENLHRAFKDYAESVTIENVIQAFEELGRELGTLKGYVLLRRLDSPSSRCPQD